MNKEAVKQLLEYVKEGKTDIEEALAKLSDLPYKELGYAKVDNHRELRNGYPEVIFGLNKTRDQVVGITESMMESQSNILITRVPMDYYKAVRKQFSQAQYHEQARCITIHNSEQIWTESTIGVITAGTADVPVAEEAAVTADFFGNRVCRFYDVGVAGIHRLLNNLEEIRKSRVLIVIAGMEGALPSVIGGLVDKPVIAVPTSVGYGANFGGITALLGMLTSCASGVSVVNIDNGFGAGYQAGMINKL